MPPSFYGNVVFSTVIGWNPLLLPPPPPPPKPQRAKPKLGAKWNCWRLLLIIRNQILFRLLSVYVRKHLKPHSLTVFISSTHVPTSVELRHE